MKRSRKTSDSAARGKTTRAEFLRPWRVAAREVPAAKKRKGWRSLDERRGEAVARQGEFAEPLPPDEPVREVSRRTFLAIAGTGTAAGIAIGCGGPAGRIALPLLNAQPEQTPGVNAWYATVCGGCPAGCGALAKSRDGRPLKLEGNPDHPISRGALCAIGQAQMGSIYDSDRLRQPEMNGAPVEWAGLDADVQRRFTELRVSGGGLRVLSPTLISPTLRGALNDFLAGFGNARHVTYDAISLAAIPAAYAIVSGVARLPRYRLERADLLVGLEADFLGTWLDPAGFTRAWASRRDPAAGPMSKHVQIEAGLSLTGASADERILAAPADLAAIAELLCADIERRTGLSPAAPHWQLPDALRARITALAESLWAARGKALVLCGLNDLPVQLFTARLNRALGAEGTTLDLQQPSLQRQGNDGELAALIAEMAAGKVAGLILLGANPLYDLPDEAGFAAALEKVPLRLAVGLYRDETAERCTHLAPDCHFLEAWRDAEPVAGVVGLGQPLIEPLFKTRDGLESLLAWSGAPAKGLDHLRASWGRTVLPRQSRHATLETLWTSGLEKGFVEYTPEAAAAGSPGDETPVRSAWAKRHSAGAGFQLLLYAKAAIGDGRHANISWLQELPDPVTKVTWDNYAQLSPAAAAALGLKTGDLVTVAPEGAASLTLPVLIQPGLHERTVAVALGYGRTAAGRTGNGVGTRAANWLAMHDGFLQSAGRPAAVGRAAGNRRLACTQLHHTLEGRDEIARVMPLSVWGKNPGAEGDHEEAPSVYAPHAHPGARWGMAVDLAKCTGCSACVVSCMAENNIPAVGRDEVSRQREMHWLRIDRYYTGDESDPGVVSQPMLCQQCDNAPCENVCPVLATSHSAEGLNQQTYNRCVGTRYCANNCPYKVRRFNWWTYPHNDAVANLGLNPDVTVRSRGVMEKCTFCVQRIAEVNIRAKNAGRRPADGEIRTACEQSCPAEALVFGDLQDPSSAVSRWMKNPRRYAVLGELGVAPAIGYLAKVKNAPEESVKEGTGHDG